MDVSIDTIIGILSMVFVTVACLIFVYQILKVSDEEISNDHKTLCNNPHCPLNKKEETND